MSGSKASKHRRTSSESMVKDHSGAAPQCSPAFLEQLHTYQETVCSAHTQPHQHPQNKPRWHTAQNCLATVLDELHLCEGPTGAQCFGASHSDLSASAISSCPPRATSFSTRDSPFVSGTPSSASSCAPEMHAMDYAAAAAEAARHAPPVPVAGGRVFNPFLPTFTY